MIRDFRGITSPLNQKLYLMKVVIKKSFLKGADSLCKSELRYGFQLYVNLRLSKEDPPKNKM